MDHGMEAGCRHIHPQDDPFRGRMRFHQSWYRRYVLGLPPGPNPHARGELYGNMLTDADGRRGFNFLSEEIYRCAEERLAENAGAVELGRLRNNLLSSQPMCFNLFVPLRSNLELANTLISLLPGAPHGISVSRVEFEFAPPPAEHLNDRTAFDIWIEYRREEINGFICIETKLTEPFSPDEYAFAERYSRWSTIPGWWWEAGAEQHFHNPQFNQLWRNHLLAFAMLGQKPNRYREAYSAVVYHDEDRNCPVALANYKQHLTSAGAATLLEWRLKDLTAIWQTVLTERAHRDWLNSFQLRYLRLEASEPVWQLFRSKS